MSFLIHDMTPIDPLVLSKQPKQDVSEMYRALRRPGAEPISHERHKESSLVPSNNGRLTAIDHFNPGGHNFDGTVHHFRQTAPAALVSQSEFIPSGPTSVLFGITNNKTHAAQLAENDAVFRMTAKNYYDQPPARRDYLTEAQEELKHYEQIQLEESRIRRDSERREILSPEGFILEKEFNKPRKYHTTSRIQHRVSDNRKYNDRTNETREIKSTHKHVLEPMHVTTNDDREYMQELDVQMQQEKRRNTEERAQMRTPSKALEDILSDHRHSPKARLSREYTATSPQERVQMAHETRADRLEKMQQYRAELQNQLEFAKQQINDEALDSYSTFTPVGGKDRTTLRAVNNPTSFTAKVTDDQNVSTLYETDDQNVSTLYERQAGEDIPIGERLGKQKGNPVIQRYSAEENQERSAAFKKRQEALDMLKRERQDLQAKLSFENSEMNSREKQDYPFYEKKASAKSAKLKSFATEAHEANMDDDVKQVRLHQREEYQAGIAAQVQSKQEAEQRVRSSRENEKKSFVNEADVWKWNHDLLEKRTHNAKLTEEEIFRRREGAGYGQDLQHQFAENEHNQKLAEAELLELNKMHARNPLVSKLVKNSLEAKKRPAQLRNFASSMQTSDPPGSADRNKKDHIPELWQRK